MYFLMPFPFALVCKASLAALIRTSGNKRFHPDVQRVIHLGKQVIVSTQNVTKALDEEPFLLVREETGVRGFMSLQQVVLLKRFTAALKRALHKREQCKTW